MNKDLPYAVSISLTEEWSYGPQIDSTRVKYFVNRIVKNIQMSALEIPSQSFEVSDVDEPGFACTIKMYQQNSPAIITMPLIRGMAYATFEFVSATPRISTIHSMLTVNGRVSGNMTGKRFEIALNNNQTWLLYAIDSDITLNFNENQFVGIEPVTNVLHLAKKQAEASASAVLDAQYWAATRPNTNGSDGNMSTTKPEPSFSIASSSSTVDNVDAECERQISIYSPVFYSSPNGYKMRLRLYLAGDGNARRTYMSLFFVLMRGEYDAVLQFPFNYKITFCLLDQTSQQRHIIDSFRPDVKSNSFQRPRSDMNTASGIPKFVPLTIVKQDNNPYVRDDIMFIKAMVDFSELPKSLVPYILTLNPGLPIPIQQESIRRELEKRAQEKLRSITETSTSANHDKPMMQ
ncbi:unnamed protein product [Rotaria sp. Silwood1]|nr:unnamed protein product [Rotaria sp. Silwood1]